MSRRWRRGFRAVGFDHFPAGDICLLLRRCGALGRGLFGARCLWFSSGCRPGGRLDLVGVNNRTTGGLFGSFFGFGLFDLDVHDVANEFRIDRIDHLAEHVETFTLPFRRWISLTHRTKVDTFTQVIHGVEVVAPSLVDEAQHDLTFDRPHRLGTDCLLALLVPFDGAGGQRFIQSTS